MLAASRVPYVYIKFNNLFNHYESFFLLHGIYVAHVDWSLFYQFQESYFIILLKTICSVPQIRFSSLETTIMCVLHFIYHYQFHTNNFVCYVLLIHNTYSSFVFLPILLSFLSWFAFRLLSIKKNQLISSFSSLSWVSSFVLFGFP